jgi:hypothetical protein
MRIVSSFFISITFPFTAASVWTDLSSVFKSPAPTHSVSNLLDNAPLVTSRLSVHPSTTDEKTLVILSLPLLSLHARVRTAHSANPSKRRKETQNTVSRVHERGEIRCKHEKAHIQQGNHSGEDGIGNRTTSNCEQKSTIRRM